METSAKENFGVDELFESLVSNALVHILDKKRRQNSSVTEQKKSHCSML